MLLSLRAAGLGDVELMQELYGDLDRDSVRFQPEHFVIAKRPKELLERHLNDPDSALFLLYGDAEPIGLIHAQLQQADDIGITKPHIFVCVWDIVVRREYRGLGGGTMMLDAALEWGKACGARYARLILS